MNVYDKITNQVITLLEAGVCPWKHFLNSEIVLDQNPTNFTSEKPYKGINAFMLFAMSQYKGYLTNEWLTFKQAKALGGTIKKGSKSTSIIYWNFSFKDKEGNTVEKDHSEARKVGYLKSYNVFNIEQTEGIEYEVKKLPELSEFQKIEKCENIIKGMPKKPRIQHEGFKAYYSPSSDFVNMPKGEFFDSREEYYSTFFHELIHSTGHHKRLNRKEINNTNVNFGDKNYSKEELVAEMGAAFLCGHTGLSQAVIENQASYINGWLKALRGNNKLLIEAAAKAQKAAEFILNN